MDDEEDERRLQEAGAKAGQGRRNAVLGRGEIVDTDTLRDELDATVEEQGDYF